MDTSIHIILGALLDVSVLCLIVSRLNLLEHRHNEVVTDDLILADAISAFDPFNR